MIRIRFSLLYSFHSERCQISFSLYLCMAQPLCFFSPIDQLNAGKNWKKHPTSNTTDINFELFLTLLIAITYGKRLLYFLLFVMFILRCNANMLVLSLSQSASLCGLDFLLYRFFSSSFVRIVDYSSFIHQCSEKANKNLSLP